MTVTGKRILEICAPAAGRAGGLAGRTAGATCRRTDWLVAGAYPLRPARADEAPGGGGFGLPDAGTQLPSLSAGEAQRLRLAALLGSGLTGVLYVLDEPTIGLHPRDSQRLMGLLRQLRDLGNTVLLVEHDLEVMRLPTGWSTWDRAAGAGGQVVARARRRRWHGCPNRSPGSTCRGQDASRCPQQARAAEGLGADGPRRARAQPEGHHRRLPAAAADGASRESPGSGKSTLLFDILDRAADSASRSGAQEPGDHDSHRGLGALRSRSSPSTSSPSGACRAPTPPPIPTLSRPSGRFSPLQPAARERGLDARHFSFNVPGGRCERCEGAGRLTRGDALPARRAGALPGLPRPALKRRDAGGAVPRAWISRRCWS